MGKDGVVHRLHSKPWINCWGDENSGENIIDCCIMFTINNIWCIIVYVYNYVLLIDNIFPLSFFLLLFWCFSQLGAASSMPIAGAAAGVSTVALQPDTATASVPWPTADTTGTSTGFFLPTVVGLRASSFASSYLSMYAHVFPNGNSSSL